MYGMITNNISAEKIPSLSMTAVQSGFIALVTGLLALFTLGADSFSLPRLEKARFQLSFFYLIFLFTIFSLYLQYKIAPKSSPSTVSKLMGSEPLFGAVIAFIFLNETISWITWIGGLTIVSSACYTSFRCNV
ncbi:MAG: EamA family transporter [Limnohabitans sp.]|nr:EamA family transporter [Limnohabitans sp.]